MNTFTKNKKQNTRDIILEAIKMSPQVTVDDLADVADVSPVTVRHHLNSLQADGFIESTSIRRKVGRPYYVYSLSESGQELFPKRYVRLTSRILDELKDRMPEAMISDLFRGVVTNIIADHRSEYEHLPFEKKLDYLVNLLSEEGFLSSWDKTEEGYRVIEHNCPYISIGNQHHEICSFDHELMLQVLDVPIQQNSCMLEGADCCEFSLESTNNTNAPVVLTAVKYN